ncbi:30S ribosome-binding factor RbfA [Patescibacteria group bacterium]|nr:30S ribosome-binding factor RbfA [Patescibacteria group bacterium]
MRAPQKKTNRVEKVNSLIQHILGPVLHENLRGADGIVTITKVETSKDLRWAKIWISIVNGDDDAVLGTLKNNIYEIQGELNRMLEMKIVPRISFHLDTGARYAEHINEIFKEIEHEREDNGNE